VRLGLRLTIAVGPSPRMYGGTDMGEVAKLVDEIGVMNYDYIGPWSKTTGLLAPLSGDPTMGGTVERSIDAYRSAGVPTNKLLMGMPFYGYGWSGVGVGNHGLYQEGKGIRGDRPYWYIEALGGDFERYRDENSSAPWLFDGKTFWTYEDPISAERKARFARDQELGGVMIWELSGDTGAGDLLKAVKRGVDGADGLEALRSGGGGRGLR
jgi:chitinase